MTLKTYPLYKTRKFVLPRYDLKANSVIFHQKRNNYTSLFLLP
ncbi:hypothetical protein BOVA172_5037 [Bacteroides ovatus]|nr:hypothetical protein BOVA172_5037 [Bacteroides ovatus]CAG9931113.1 hypothetical protein BOVA208_5367 [Bacteroides ovatus]